MALIQIKSVTTICPCCGLKNSTRFSTPEWIEKGFAWSVVCEKTNSEGVVCNEEYVASIQNFRTVAKSWKDPSPDPCVWEEDTDQTGEVVVDPEPEQPQVLG